MIRLSAQGMDVAMMAQVTFTSPDRVRDVIHNCNTDGFDSLSPKYAGGRPVKRGDQADSRCPAPTITGCRYRPGACRSWPTTWWRRGWARTYLTKGSGTSCVMKACSFQAVKTWKTSTDPNYEAKKNRVLHLYAIADGKREPGQVIPPWCCAWTSSGR